MECTKLEGTYILCLEGIHLDYIQKFNTFYNMSRLASKLFSCMFNGIQWKQIYIRGTGIALAV